MRTKNQLIRRHILKSILWCFLLTILLTILGLSILFASESQSSEGKQGVTLLIFVDILVIVAIALTSFGSILASIKFIYTDTLLFLLTYFLPAIFSSFFACLVNFKMFHSATDKISFFAIIPSLIYFLLWTISYFRLIKKLRTL